uniref:glutamate receptor ionotropic, delta-1-like n=1 Tax=Myxine glutinosa TaxID=7769 RepID=UPI00358DE08C
MTVYKNLLAQNKKQHQQLPITMFLTRKKRQVTPTPSAETEVANEGEDTTPPDEAPDAVAPSEELKNISVANQVPRGIRYLTAKVYVAKNYYGFCSLSKKLTKLKLLELQESGELEALRQKWWPRRTGKCDPYGSPMSPARPQGLDLPGLAGAFALLAAGLLLACLLGACELCWSSRPHHLCPPKVEDKELEMQQVRQRLGSVERLHEMAAASRKPLALLPGESPCDPDSPAEHGREYRTLGFAIGSFLMDDKATGRPMAVGGPGPSMTGSQPPSQPPPPLPVPLCAHSITEPLLGHGKQRAPNGGLQRQSPLKAFGRTSFHMPVDYISEGLCEPLHGTSI